MAVNLSHMKKKTNSGGLGRGSIPAAATNIFYIIRMHSDQTARSEHHDYKTEVAIRSMKITVPAVTYRGGREACVAPSILTSASRFDP